MTDPNIRPEVVDAILGALTKMDPDVLAGVEHMGATPAELAAARDLFLNHVQFRQARSDRWLEAMNIFIDTGISFGTSPTWAQLFDALAPGDPERLAGLYDVLEDGAREEYDRRYGRPAL